MPTQPCAPTPAANASAAAAAGRGMGATAYVVKMTAPITEERTSHGGRCPPSHRSLAAPSPRRAGGARPPPPPPPPPPGGGGAPPRLRRRHKRARPDRREAQHLHAVQRQV